MSTRDRAIAYLLPWAGLILAMLAFALVSQVGSNSVFDSCRTHGLPFVLLVVILGWLLTAAGALASWRIIRRHEHETAPRQFLAMLSIGAAALFSLPMLYALLASLLIPRCFG
jgi:hypothetical protein